MYTKQIILYTHQICVSFVGSIYYVSVSICIPFAHAGATAHIGAYFGEGSGVIHLSDVKCSGSEYDVTKCETQDIGINSSHSLDVGVKCQPGMLNIIVSIHDSNNAGVAFFTADEAYREGDIRLVGGSYNWEGRVEMYWSGSWGTISDSSWTADDASVVCKQLQHAGNGNYLILY